MPNIDGGHYFLTLLAPVRMGETVDRDGLPTTYSHLLRSELTNLPTALQSMVSVETGLNSPFARCHRTHFLRMFVIDQPMFNGRDPVNPLWNIVKNADPLIHKPFDVLSRPWLALSADFDLRPDEPDQGLTSWAEGLWNNSEAEMRAIFANCHGFDDISSAPAFAAYVARCQVETTMSFNDYWPGRPPLKALTLGKVAVQALAAAVAVLVLGSLLFGFSFWWLLPALVAGIAFGLQRLWDIGKKPFPAAPDSDLPSVLKALHVQQRFGFFAESVQGQDAQALHNSFAAFLQMVQPADVAHPTQPPGVIRSDGVMLARREVPDDDKARQAAL